MNCSERVYKALLF